MIQILARQKYKIMMSDQQKQSLTCLQSNVGDYFLISLQLIQDRSVLLIKITNHRTFEHFQQIIDNNFIYAHQGLGLFFESPFALMNYIALHIKDVVISKEGEIHLHIVKMGFNENASIMTNRKNIDPSEKNRLKIEQLTQQIRSKERQREDSDKARDKYLQEKISMINSLQQKLKGMNIKIQSNEAQSKSRFKTSIILCMGLILALGLCWFVQTIKVNRLKSNIQDFRQIIDLNISEIHHSLPFLTEKLQQLNTTIHHIQQNLQNNIIYDRIDTRINHTLNQYVASNKISNQQAKLHELQTQILKLKNLTSQIDQKITKFTQEIEEQNIVAHFGHHPENPHSPHFQITNNGKSITIEHTAESNWYNFINKTPLPLKQRTTYKFKITKATLKYLYLGFGTKDIFGKSWSAQPQAIYYNCGGVVYEGGTIKNAKIQMSIGDTLTMTADLKNNTVTWVRNDNEMIMESPLPLRMRNTPIYLVLYFYTKGDLVEILQN